LKGREIMQTDDRRRAWFRFDARILGCSLRARGALVGLACLAFPTGSMAWDARSQTAAAHQCGLWRRSGLLRLVAELEAAGLVRVKGDRIRVLMIEDARKGGGTR